MYAPKGCYFAISSFHVFWEVLYLELHCLFFSPSKSPPCFLPFLHVVSWYRTTFLEAVFLSLRKKVIWNSLYVSV